MLMRYIRKKNEIDNLLVSLNLYHENVKMTLEINPKTFLNTETIHTDQGIKTQVYKKTDKLPTY